MDGGACFARREAAVYTNCKQVLLETSVEAVVHLGVNRRLD